MVDCADREGQLSLPRAPSVREGSLLSLTARVGPAYQTPLEEEGRTRERERERTKESERERERKRGDR